MGHFYQSLSFRNEIFISIILCAALPSSEGRAKRPGSSEKDDDAKSVSSVKSATASTPNTAARRTPAQVKAESAARKAKVHKQISV